MSVTVIVPLDGSEASEKSLAIARELQIRRGGTLKLISVVEITTEFDAWIETAPFTLEDELDSWLADRRKYLRGLAEQLGEGVEFEVRVGRPSVEIRAVAEAQDEAVIVMASHGRGGLQQLVLGSVALSVVHDVHCPVIVVHMQGERTDPSLKLETVLLPTDGTAFSERVIDDALEILGEPKPALRLVQVLEHPAWTAHSTNAGLISEYLEASRGSAQQYLDQIATKLRARGFSTDAELRSGAAADGILASATEHDADLIAMATHGRGGIGRLLLGSVAQRVLHRTGVPLLLIHPAPQKNDAPTTGIN
jgi:nucleotide-binding universal stress UspA family protein